MKFKKVISALLCGAFAMGMLSACGEEVDRDKYIARTREEATAESDAEAAKRNSQAAEERNLTPANWADMKFNIDGTEIVLDQLPYATLASMGWSYEPYIYGLDAVQFEKGVNYDMSINLMHEGYDEGVMKVGFTNFSDTPCSYDKNHVWGIEFTSYGKNAYPDVKVGDITWGSDETDIKAVFGEPVSTATAEDGSTELVYGDGVYDAIKFYLYDGKIGRIAMVSFD